MTYNLPLVKESNTYFMKFAISPDILYVYFNILENTLL